MSNMKKLILIFIFLANCATFQDRDYNKEAEIVVDDQLGCFYYSGRERLNCNNKQMEELQDIKNTKKIKTEVLKNERINDTTVFTSTKYNVTSKIYFVVNREETNYSLIYNIKRNGFWTGVGMVLMIALKGAGILVF